MISVLCPTRNRPDQVRRMVGSAFEHAEEDVQFVFYVDDDAQTSVPNDLPVACDVIVGPRIVLSEMWNECYQIAAGDICMHAGDDLIFRSHRWDTLIEQAFARYPDRIAFVYGDAMDFGGRMGTHGFLHRNWVNTVGYFVPPYFVSDYNDTWLNEVAEMIGRKVFVPEVVTEHMHPVWGKGELDATHQERLERHRQNDPLGLYNSLAPKRAEDAAKLQAFIDACLRDS